MDGVHTDRCRGTRRRWDQPLRAACSPFAHRRCAYTWTLQHTCLVNMQVRQTTTYTPGCDGMGWWGSNPGIPTRSVRSCLAGHEGEELGIEG
jgi:hypothetical protein